jgi:hypothetical protein
MNELDGKYVRRSLDMTFDDNKEEKKNVIEGLAAVYNSRASIGDWFYEIIAPGAFDRADMSDVALYLNHDITKLPLARCRKNSNLNSLSVWADADGLRMRTELDTENNADARALCSAIERGDVDGMSFVFVVDSEEWSDLNAEMPTRTITGIKKVVEVSAVTYPAYDDTTIGFARAKKAQESDLAALERAKAEKENREKDEFVELEMKKKKILMMN